MPFPSRASLLPAAAICLGLSSGFFGCKRPVADAPRKRGEVVLQVQTLRIAPQPFEEKLTATGSLEADEQVMLRAEVSGIVEEIAFDEGQKVERGTLLLKLRAEDLRAQVKRAEAQLKLAETSNERQQQLVKSQAISRSEVDQARSSLAVASADLELAKAALAKTEVRAPFDGVIGLRTTSLGEYVTPTTDIATFRKLDPLKLETSVPERYRRYLREGLKVEFAIAGAKEPFSGEVYALEPGIDPVTRTIRVRARVPNADGQLAPGAFVEAAIVLETMPDAILIPALAVVPGVKDEAVFIAENGVARTRRITTSLRTRDSVLVQEGLSAGDEVIVSSILQLREGAKIQPLPAEAEKISNDAARGAALR
jgi:membrane fusion protein (multidrug efflux system)